MGPLQLHLRALIAGPKKPDANQLFHIMQPLIDELLSLYQGVDMQLNPLHPVEVTRVSAVLGVISADWPATCDLCGFAHSASLSHCSKCESRLPSSASKNEPAFFELHPDRSRRSHLLHARGWQQCGTPHLKAQYLSEHGYAPCAFLRLPYFSPGKDHAVDWMHSGYMGTCKDVFELLKSHFYLTDRSFDTIEERSRQLKLPPTIGRICHKLHAKMSQLKADQVCTYVQRHFFFIFTA